jgi:competence protein ComGC
MSKRGKLITLILLVIAMIVISFLVLLGLPQKNIEEDYRLTNEMI